MKTFQRIIPTSLIGLSLLTFGISNSALASTSQENGNTRNQPTTVIAKRTTRTPGLTSIQASPFNLVYLTYQGFFKDQGLRGGNFVRQDFRLGRIQAEDIVKAAIETGHARPESLKDAKFLRAVKTQLKSLSTPNFR